MNDSRLLKKLEQAQMGVLFKVPFFAPGAAKLTNVLIGDDEARMIFGEPKEAMGVLRWTAATDGETIKWYRGFVEIHPVEALVTVMCHEIWHCLAGHLWRAPVGVDWERWNIAADHETNTMLLEFSQGKTPDPFPFPEPKNAYYADQKYTGWAVEPIYADLEKNGGQGGGKGGKTSPRGSGGSNSASLGPSSMPNFGQMIKPGQNVTQKQPEKLSNDWQNTLLQSAKLTRGHLPGSLTRMIEGIVHPKIDWASLLRSWLRERANDDWDFNQPAVEYEPTGFLLPSLKSERIGSVVFASDWSGSTFGDLVNKFHAEKQSCLDEMRPSKLIDIGFDTRVVKETEYHPGDEIDPNIGGGGGTSFVEVLARCEELQPPPKCVVVLTDLCGTFPDKEPPFPVLWCVYGNAGARAPFGETVYCD